MVSAQIHRIRLHRVGAGGQGDGGCPVGIVVGGGGYQTPRPAGQNLVGQLIPDRATFQLSAAVPTTVARALVMRWPAVGAEMDKVGLVTSRKFTCKARFEAIMKGRFVLVVEVPPIQLVEVTQLEKTKPLAGAEVML